MLLNCTQIYSESGRNLNGFPHINFLRHEVWDVDEEPLLRHFCLEEECKEVLQCCPYVRFSLVCLQFACSQVLTWFKDANYERPQDRKLMIDWCFTMLYYTLDQDFADRMSLAKRAAVMLRQSPLTPW